MEYSGRSRRIGSVIRIGPAGWQYKDWQGIVYPKPKPRGFRELSYIARLFDTVEINTSFYGPPRPTTTQQWMDLVAENPAFRFTAKLWKGFTHERNATAKDERDVRDGIAPLVDANRFGALLLQFPWSFKNTPENWYYLQNLIKRFAEFPLVLEVRHASWNEEPVRDLLAELCVGLCNIDQPLFSRSIKPSAHVTAPVGYVRLHGRNYKQWFSAEADVRERYDYLYTLDELEPWAERARIIAGRAEQTYAITNNHNIGKAVVNGLELKSLLGLKLPSLPEQLVQHYPELATLTPSQQ